MNFTRSRLSLLMLFGISILHCYFALQTFGQAIPKTATRVDVTSPKYLGVLKDTVVEIKGQLVVPNGTYQQNTEYLIKGKVKIGYWGDRTAFNIETNVWEAIQEFNVVRILDVEEIFVTETTRVLNEFSASETLDFEVYANPAGPNGNWRVGKMHYCKGNPASNQKGSFMVLQSAADMSLWEWLWKSLMPNAPPQ